MKREIQLFPDIRLIYGTIPDIADKNILEISYCMKGVREYKINSGYYYLTPKSCMILRHDTKSESRTSYSPNYCGISILIDSRCKSADFADILDMSAVMKSIRCTEQCVLTSAEKIQKIFSDIYNESTNPKASMLRIKTLELLMLLSERKTVSREQQEFILRVGAFICRNVSEHYTISELSEMFRLNQTTLKEQFRQNLGCPVYSYVKNRKMFRAAELILASDMRIIDIAEEVGYCNASKFSSAFREVMGVNPKFYQMEHKKLYAQQRHFISENFAY
ncbi:AraC family transcriptional regulator [Ruminococcus sp.]|uniref:helix-turn-helix domain-containing protein n=1 Tax=Ruminococcus sp. TaxID=41978 RepID=UPI0025DFAD9A|nr:AraC family transcriptional regulator [Ruminococcus sp.]